MQKQVTLNPGESQRVPFLVSPTGQGTYNAEFDSLVGSFVCIADVVLSDLTITPSPCYIGDPLSISIEALNPNPNEVTRRLEGTLTKGGGIIKLIDKIVSFQPGANTIEWQMTTVAFEIGTYTLTLDSIAATFELISKAPEQLTITGVIYTYIPNFRNLTGLVEIVELGLSQTAHRFKFEVPPGTYTLKVTVEGYSSWQQVITGEAGEVKQTSAQMTPLASEWQIAVHIYDEALDGYVPYDAHNTFTVTLKETTGEIIASKTQATANPTFNYACLFVWGRQIIIEVVSNGIYSQLVDSEYIYWRYKPVTLGADLDPYKAAIHVYAYLERQYI